ncbi:MAG: PEP-CTERM sorting domain-containing protein [Phycisphaerae bacterium]|jgi:hypothetical protein
MKRILIINLVLGLCAVAAQAGITWNVLTGPINITMEKVGTYTVTGDSGSAIVNVYDMTMWCRDPNTVETVVALTIGSATGAGSDPFQAASVYKAGSKYHIGLTPVESADETFLDPCDGSNAYQADSRFMPSGEYTDPNDPCDGIENWMNLRVPTETNDGSIDPNQNVDGDMMLGKGGMEVLVAIPLAMQSPNLKLKIARIGIVQGDMVYFQDQSAYYDGIRDLSEYTAPILVPEPATLAFLSLGAVTLLRRRRGR